MCLHDRQCQSRNVHVRLPRTRALAPGRNLLNSVFAQDRPAGRRRRVESTNFLWQRCQMLTRVEVHGFRSFYEFGVSLRPFQVIAGPNAVGKSNFFDALRLLSVLAEHDLKTAFQAVRGDPLEQFTTRAPGHHLSEMRFAVEAIVDPKVRDQWGEEAELRNTHLRYELALAQDTDPHGRRYIRIVREELSAVPKDREQLPFHPSESFRRAHIRRVGGRGTPFIATESSDRVLLHQDGRAGRKREFKPAELETTVLSGANSVTFRHAFAMRQQLTELRFLHLEPTALRSPSPKSPFHGQERLAATGANLPAVLWRLQGDDPALLSAVAVSLRRVVREVRAVDVWDDVAQQRLVARAFFDSGGPYPASLLSDGTLRLFALAALQVDPTHTGTVCFEEPENGIQPQRMAGLLTVLRGLATETDDDSESHSAPPVLRQLLVNTHSPVLVSLVEPEDLLFCSQRRLVQQELGGSIGTTAFLTVQDQLPLRTPGTARTSVNRAEVRSYLESVNFAPWKDD